MIKEALDIRALPQQGINPRGDCGACCLAAVAQESVPYIYEVFERTDGLTYHCMIQLIKKLNLKYDNALPVLADWRKDEEWQAFGAPAWKMSYEWLENAYRKVANGWVGIANINSNGNGINDPVADHWVIVYDAKFDGQELWKVINVFISCPTKGTYELNVKDFLKNYGGYNTIWVKPKLK